MINRVTEWENQCWNYNKPPEKNFQLIQHCVEQTRHIPADELARALKESREESAYMPPLQKVISLWEANRPKAVKFKHVPCDICNGVGKVFSPQFRFDVADFMDIASLDMKPRANGTYISRCIGRCTCDNGSLYASREMPIAKPMQWIIDLAKEQDCSCDFMSDEICRHYRRKVNGEEAPDLSKWDKVVEEMFSRQIQNNSERSLNG